MSLRRGTGLRALTCISAVLIVGGSWTFARGATRPVPRRDTQMVVYRVGTSERAIALTFDDGPFATYTPQVLDILAQEGAHATFFLVGQRASALPGIVARILREGDEIANHTWSHPHLTALLEPQISSEITAGAKAIEALGVHPV